MLQRLGYAGMPMSTDALLAATDPGQFHNTQSGGSRVPQRRAKRASYSTGSICGTAGGHSARGLNSLLRRIVTYVYYRPPVFFLFFTEAIPLARVLTRC